MCMVTQQDLIKVPMTVAGDEQCSLLMLQCELTVLSQPCVPYCMKEGKIPVLIWLSTPYLYCTCTLKGWKNLAENKEKKDAALKNERSCCLLSGQTGEGFATCRGNKAKLHPLLSAVGVMETVTLGLDRTTLTACGYFLYNQQKLLSSRGSTSGSFSGVCAWRCAITLLLWDINSPGSLRYRISKQKNQAIFSVQGVAGQGRLCLSPFLNNRAHNVALGVPRNWEFGVFNCLGLWGSFAFYFFLVYMVLTVN